MRTPAGRNVELVKVHYYDKIKANRNISLHTISREVQENQFNDNVIIKKNIFGHKWVLKINDEEKVPKKFDFKLILYVMVFFCLVVLVVLGFLLITGLEKKLIEIFCAEFNVPIGGNSTVFLVKNVTLRWEEDVELDNTSKITTELPFTTSSTFHPSARYYCKNCTSDEVCLKKTETATPACVPASDRGDPTGCGGLCKINVEFCAILDKNMKVYQCISIRNRLACPEDTFNCGDQCISFDWRCDGVIHCKDMSDEKDCDCDLDTNFQCTDSISCLPYLKQCDGAVDCWDQSDEKDCRKECFPTEFSCLEGRCIPMENFCDGFPHCSDASDEPKGC